MDEFVEAHRLFGAAGRNWKRVELGQENLKAIRAYFAKHLCATNVECSKALGISVFAVGRHVTTIRSEWLTPPSDSA